MVVAEGAAAAVSLLFSPFSLGTSDGPFSLALSVDGNFCGGDLLTGLGLGDPDLESLPTKVAELVAELSAGETGSLPAVVSVSHD